jgi:cell wall-associated NlpC family hydrolase
VTDGRKNHHARKAASLTGSLTAALTTAGLGLATASPAAAAPDNDIDAAKVRAERTSEQAAVADKRHDAAEQTLVGARDRLQKLRKQIARHHRIVETNRAEVASSLVEEFDGTAGASAPARPLPNDSETLLTNVTYVTEDTDGRAEAISRSGARVKKLSAVRSDVRDRIGTLAKREARLQQHEERLDARAAEASAVLEDLEAEAAAEAEAKRIEAAGGPAVAYAKAQVGKSYVYGAAGPDAFDCSGLTMMAWQQAGVSLPHNSGAQYAAGQKISESELKPGDLVFYYSPISHVGIYIGNGQVANALNPGSGVQISGLHDMPYTGAARVG